MGSEVTTLFETVVDGGYCIGCGACAAVPDSPIRMELDDSGRYRPRLDGSGGETPVLAVCPFTDEAEHEDEIGARLFAADCEPHDRIGFHMRTYVVDLRDLSTVRWLASLARRAPSAALCTTPAQRLLCRMLGISRAGPP